MRRRPLARPTAGIFEVPDALRAGACVEVWAPGDPWPHLKVRRLYWDARHRWCWWVLAVDPWEQFDRLPAELLVPTSPWSWAGRNQKRRLVEHGLPATWVPRFASPDGFGAALPMLRHGG